MPLDTEKVKMRTIVERVKSGLNPEGKQMFKTVKRRVPILKEGQTPPPPPNFSPDEIIKTAPEENPPILTQAQAVSEALDRKQEEHTQ